MPRCGDHPQRQTTQIHLILIPERPVRVSQLRTRRSQHLGTFGRQFPATRDEVRMEMRLHHEPGPQSPPLQLRQIRTRIPLWIHHQSRAVAQIHHIGAVPQPLIHDRGDSHGQPLIKCLLE